MEERRPEALAVAGNSRLLYDKLCKGRSFIFLFSLCPSLSPLFLLHQLLLLSSFFHTLLCHPAYWFVLLLFFVWSLVLVELSSGNWDSHRLFPHSTSNPSRRLPREGGSYPASYCLPKTKTGFWSLSSLSQAKLILLWTEKKNWKPWSSFSEQLVRKKMVVGCTLPPQCEVVFMAEHMTGEATLSLSMRQYKEVM